MKKFNVKIIKGNEWDDIKANSFQGVVKLLEFALIDYEPNLSKIIVRKDLDCNAFLVMEFERKDFDKMIDKVSWLAD